MKLSKKYMRSIVSSNLVRYIEDFFKEFPQYKISKEDWEGFKKVTLKKVESNWDEISEIVESGYTQSLIREEKE